MTSAKIITAFLQTDPNDFDKQQEGRLDFLIRKGIPFFSPKLSLKKTTLSGDRTLRCLVVCVLLVANAA